MRSDDGNFLMQVLVHGRQVTEYRHEADTFVEGRSGSEYQIMVGNGTSGRVLAVVSVDGLSVMDGKPASKYSIGYIMNPHDTLEIPGWRLNDNAVAKFGFGDLPKSYAAQMGKGGNIGVIGVVFIPEKRFEPRVEHRFDTKTWQSNLGSHTTSVYRGEVKGFEPESFGFGDEVIASASVAPEPSIGTVFGGKEQHHVNREQFVRAVDASGDPLVVCKLVLRYDTAQNLEKRGIVVVDPHARGDRVIDADPFPADRPQGATPPPGWKG